MTKVNVEEFLERLRNYQKNYKFETTQRAVVPEFVIVIIILKAVIIYA